MNIWESLYALLSPFLIGLLTAAGCGLIIGLEREFNTHDKPGHLGGIRTFVMISILGYLSGRMGIRIPVFPLLILGSAVLLIAVGYWVQAYKGNLGLTSELALILTLLIGEMVADGEIREALACVVLTTVTLSLKEQLHGMIRQLTQEELYAFVKFIVLALLVLPMLPDIQVGPENLLNPRELGWIVVLVLSISFSGYLLLKFGSAHKGILFTALIGGLISSTLIAWIFSNRSKERPDLAPVLGAGIVLASSVMLVRVGVLTTIFAPSLSIHLLFPLILMLAVSLWPLLDIYKHPEQTSDVTSLAPGNPLDIKNAVFFVFLYGGVTYLMFASRQWAGETLTLFSGALAGIADMDAITIATSKWASSSAGNTGAAGIIILLAILSNSVFKLSVSLLAGVKAMRISVLKGFGGILLAGLLYLLWSYINRS